MRFGLKISFASTKFCDLYTEMVQGRQILMFYTTIVHMDNSCGYKILRFWANPRKYQTLVPTKYLHLKVIFLSFLSLCLYTWYSFVYVIYGSTSPNGNEYAIPRFHEWTERFYALLQ